MKRFCCLLLIIVFCLTGCSRIEKFEMPYFDGEIIKGELVQYDYCLELTDYVLLKELSEDEINTLINGMKDIEFISVDGSPKKFDGIGALIYYEGRIVYITANILGVAYDGTYRTSYIRDICNNKEITQLLQSFLSDSGTTDELGVQTSGSTVEPMNISIKSKVNNIWFTSEIYGKPIS